MIEIVIIAGKKKSNISQLSRFLVGQGYVSIFCKTAAEIVKELSILRTCGIHVSLVVIEPTLLAGVSDDLVSQLSKCALDVPFILFDELHAPADLIEIFEKICAHRTKFRPGANRLANVLKEAGAEITCG